MRNILDDKPTRDLHGGPAFARSFVEDEHCSDRAILDIGCGFGWFELIALDRGARSIAAIEPTEADLATARTHIQDERVDFRVASALDLPFESGAFNTVACWEVLEHLPPGSEEQAFREVARVLAPGGVFYLSTPCAGLRSRVADPAWWLIRHRHYSRDRLRLLATTAGFTVEQLFAKGGWWRVTAMTNLYVAKWDLRGGRRSSPTKSTAASTPSGAAAASGLRTSSSGPGRPEVAVRQQALSEDRAAVSVDGTSEVGGVRAGLIVLIGIAAGNLGNYGFHLASARYLGPASYADVASLAALAGFITLPLVGVQLALARYVAEFAATGNRPAIAYVFRRSLGLAMKVGVGATALALLLAVPVQRLLDISSLERRGPHNARNCARDDDADRLGPGPGAAAFRPLLSSRSERARRCV